MNRILITLSLLLLVAASTMADSNRVLLRPPDGYEGIEVGGVPHVLGQVYLTQYADTSLLTPFGFRDFAFVGSTSRYKKIKAWWPLNTDVDALPDQVLGLSYEKMTEEDLAYAAVMNPSLVPTGKNLEEIKSARYKQMYPVDGKPHLIYKDQPYIQGEIWIAQDSDEDYLETMGIELLYEFSSNDAFGDPSSFSRWTAMWPMSLKASQLPHYVVGMYADQPSSYYMDEYASNNQQYYPSTVVVRHVVQGSSCVPRYNTHYNRTYTKKYGSRTTREWTAERRNNPSSYWYNTRSKTTLHPTTIGSYDSNRYLRKVKKYPSYYYGRGCRSSYRYHYHR